MNILNRGQIVVFPTKAFEMWSSLHSEEELFFAEVPEPTVYLMEEEFWDDELIIEKYRKKIVQRECMTICSDESKWPIIKDNEQFRIYFSVHLGVMVFDLLDSELSLESIES
jgi:hypothetical protein